MSHKLLPRRGVPIYPDPSYFPNGSHGDLAVSQANDGLYEFNGSVWTLIASSTNVAAVSDTNSTDLTVTNGVLTSDLRYADTNSIDLDVGTSGLTASVKISSTTSPASGNFSALTEIKSDGMYVSVPESGVLDSTLTNYVSATGSISPSDTVFSAIEKAGYFIETRSPAQVVTAGESGAMFSHPQDAIDSITDANSLTKPYEVIVFPGTYIGNIVLKDGVFLTNGITATVFIVGKITSTGTSGIKGISVSYAPVADNEIIVDVSGTRFSLTDVTVSAIGSGDFICTAIRSSCTSFASTNTTVADVRSTIITKNFIGWDLIGTGTVTLFNLAVSMRGNYSAGTHSLIRNGTTGRITISGGTLFFTDTIGTFAGEVRGFSTVAANTSGAIDGLSMRLTGISGGTATGFHSDGAGANLLQTNCVAVINGFTTMNITDTAAADTQKVMQCTTNRPLTQAGAGVSIVTPKAEEHCGFIAFASSGDAYSYVVGTRVFTLLRAGSGLIKSVPVSWAANQTVTLTDYATNYVYIDGNGAIGTNTSSTGLSDTTIILFEVYSDGTAYVVAKENHGANFQEKPSTYLHKANGPLLENNAGATIGTLVAASRTVKLTGACTLLDHGLETTISDSAATALTFRVVYVAASGLTQLGAPTTAAPLFWNNGTAATALTGTQRANMRVGVLKDDINSANPTYIIQLDATGTYASNASAANAIAAGNVSAFSPQLRALEIVQLGFITVTNAAGGSIVVVTPAKQVANQTYAGGTTSSAGLTTTDVSLFDKILSGADVTVQIALNTIDENAAGKALANIYTAEQTFLSTKTTNNTTNTSGVGDNYAASDFASSASGTTATFQFGPSGTAGVMQFLIDVNTDGGICCACGYKSDIINALSDPSGLFLATDAGTGIYVSKSANSATVSVKNRTGATKIIGVIAIRNKLNAATAWS